MLMLVNGVWHDNVIGKIKTYDGIGSNHIHKFTMGKNSDGTPIVVCEKCSMSRLWVMTFEKDRREERDDN